MRQLTTMKRIACVGAAALFLATGAAAGPQMTIHRSTFDFGYAPQNAKLSYPFWLHSTGDDSLKIIKVVPG